jgi:hypothetical protein
VLAGSLTPAEYATCSRPPSNRLLASARSVHSLQRFAAGLPLAGLVRAGDLARIA